MAKITKATIEAKGIEIAVQTTSAREDYFSLTDIAAVERLNEKLSTNRPEMLLDDSSEAEGGKI